MSTRSSDAAATDNQAALARPIRPGVTAVHSLDRFVLSVPSLETAGDFFTQFGLDVRAARDRLDLYTHGHPHRWGSIHQGGARKRLEYLSFGIYAADADAFRRRIDQEGCAADPHPLGDPDGIWLRSPDGVLMQLAVREKSTPNEKSIPAVIATPEPGRGAAPSRNRAPRVRPRRLSHVLIFTPDLVPMIEFSRRVLGLRLSDRAGDGIAFLHGAHGSDHHLLALVRSDGAGMHHTSWDVASVNEVGMGAEHMKKSGYTRGWGVGRHVLGSNYFYYVGDPWGSYAEYSFDIDFVPADLDWPAGHHAAEDAFYVWGPQPPGDFAINYELASAPPVPPAPGASAEPGAVQS